MSATIKVHREWDREEDAIRGGNGGGEAMKKKSVEEGIVQKSAQVTMNNKTHDMSMLFKQNHDWYGSVSAYYPTSIRPNNPATFVHFSDPTNGSKGAVLYYAKINPQLQYAWLLAWSAPVGSDSSPPNNQVYVETGNEENYKNIDWTVIEEKLNNSTNQSNYKDPDTGCTASAEIFTGSNKAAVIPAQFNITI